MSLCSICRDITFYPKHLAKPRRGAFLDEASKLVETSKVDEHTDFVAFLHSSREDLKTQVSEGRASGNVCPFCEILHDAFQKLESQVAEAEENGEPIYRWNTLTTEMDECEDLWLLWKPIRRHRDKDGLLIMSRDELSIGCEGYDLAIGMLIQDEASEDEIRSKSSWNHQLFEFDELRRETFLSDNNTGSLRALKLAKSWIDTCKSTHSTCGYPNGMQKKLPTRLLELSPGAVANTIRLVESANLPIQTRYVTLSHRWGNVHPLTTTLANYKHHKDGFAIEGLPKTFYDAISITSFIGYRHIWIDSLCITQDSDVDKYKEIPKMADYYGGAEFNIIAANAENCLEGCFQSRNGLSIRPLWIPVCVVGRGQDVSARTKSFVRVYLDKRALVSSLDLRGWVLQERVFAPRTLYYGKFLRYTCPEMRASETHPEGLVPNNRRQTTNFGFNNQNNPDLDRFGAITRAMEVEKLAEPSKALQVEQLYQWWYQLSSVYSSLQLTFEDDRTLAISSCASKIGDLAGDEYLAGLWKADLIRGLNWIAGGKMGGGRNPKLEKVRPPTWSWLSLAYCQHPSNAIWSEYYFSHGRDPKWPSGLEEVYQGEIVFRVDRCSVLAADERNKFGPVSVAELQVYGFLVNDLKIQPEEDTDDEYIVVHPTQSSDRLTIDWDEHPLGKNLTLQVSILPITFGIDPHSELHPEEINGLVVVGIGGAKYERIGYALHIPASWLEGVTKQCVTLV